MVRRVGFSDILYLYNLPSSDWARAKTQELYCGKRFPAASLTRRTTRPTKAVASAFVGRDRHCACGRAPQWKRDSGPPLGFVIPRKALARRKSSEAWPEQSRQDLPRGECLNAMLDPQAVPRSLPKVASCYAPTVIICAPPAPEARRFHRRPR